jgi:peptide-methionine (S)-S-oxide reductase
MRNFFMSRDQKIRLVTAEEALPGRREALPVPSAHFVNGNPISPPYPQHLHCAMFGMGCFWGAEKLFWQLTGVFSTAVGYSGGHTPNPTYEEVCSGKTAHNEVVQVIFDPRQVAYEQLLKHFWQEHDPTQGMRQGGDMGSQYRSGIYCDSPAQQAAAELTKGIYQQALQQKGRGTITTEILTAGPFYHAEEYHQQYLAKNPGGYCGIGGTGINLPVLTENRELKPPVKYQVPDMVRLLSGQPLDEVIKDPANPNLIVDKDS